MTSAPVDADPVASRLAYDLYAEFADRVDTGTVVDALVLAELARLHDVRIQEFVPIFVRRRVRAELRRLVSNDGAARPVGLVETADYPASGSMSPCSDRGDTFLEVR